MGLIEAPNPMFEQNGTTQPYHGPICAKLLNLNALIALLFKSTQCLRVRVT